MLDFNVNTPKPKNKGCAIMIFSTSHGSTHQVKRMIEYEYKYIKSFAIQLENFKIVPFRVMWTHYNTCMGTTYYFLKINELKWFYLQICKPGHPKSCKAKIVYR